MTRKPNYPCVLYSDITSTLCFLSWLDPFKFSKSITKKEIIFLLLNFLSNLIDATAVPPVAIRSSMRRILSDFLIEDDCISTISWPYYNLYLILLTLPGNFPDFLIGINGISAL